MNRPRRQIKRGGANKEEIARLKAAREGKESRLDQIKDDKVEPVFQELTEEGYAEYVRNRQDEDFVVDPEGVSGYIDDGEECFQTKDDPSDAGQAKEKKQGGLFAVFQRTKAKPKASMKRPLQNLQQVGAHLNQAGGVRKDKPAFLPDDIDLDEDDVLLPVQNPKKVKRRRITGHTEPKPKPVPEVHHPAMAPKAVPVEAAPPPVPESTVSPSAVTAQKDASKPQHRRSQLFESTGGAKRSFKRPAPPPKQPDIAQQAEDVTPIAAPVGAANLRDLVVDKKGDDQFLNLFWFDVFEEPYENHHGVLYLFGKALLKQADPKMATDGGSIDRAYATVCVQVHGLERVMYVLPKLADNNKPLFSMEEVYTEIKDTLGKMGYLRPPQQMGASQSPPQLQGFRVRAVKKKYCFELPNVPREETDYFELRLPASTPPLPADLSGRTFDRVFGTHTSITEQLLLGNKMSQGPCWLQVKNPQLARQKASLCPAELMVASPRSITMYPVENLANFKNVLLPLKPRLKVMALSTKTLVNRKTNQHEIVSVSLVVHGSSAIFGPTSNPERFVSFTAVADPRKPDVRFPLSFQKFVEQNRNNSWIHIFRSETELLQVIFQKIREIDPDVLTGHNILNYDLDLLLIRARLLRITNWCSLGRIARESFPGYCRSASVAGSKLLVNVATAGRLVCDTYLLAKEFLMRETAYTLTNLVRTQLHQNRGPDIDPQDVPKMFANDQSLFNLLHHNHMSAVFSMHLMFKLALIPLTLQITQLAGNVWNRTLRSARAERVEFILLHQFYMQDYICPDKYFRGRAKWGRKPSRKRGKPGYAGGLVLEPKKGLYDKYILLLDFNSLYPSIVQEFNICHTTVKRPPTQDLPEDDGGDADRMADVEDKDIMDGVELADPSVAQGILPRVIAHLVQSRRAVKRLMGSEKDPSLLAELNIRQLALKIMANSMYGCLGFKNSRFFAKPLAAAITLKGREILARTVEVAEKQTGLEVIYGDTDSIMLNTNSSDLRQVNDMAKAVIAAVNKLYNKVELDVDGVYRMMLLLKKKKYAALMTRTSYIGPQRTLSISYTVEKKGLDMVRRDWCGLSKTAGEKVLDIIFAAGQAQSNPDAAVKYVSTEDVVEQIHAYIGALAKEVKAGEIELAQYIITKGLTKSPSEYKDKKGQPHLQVALRMMESGKPVNVGDHIPYVICRGTSSSFADRARHPEEVMRSKGSLDVDTEWYLSQQLLPPIARLVEPIEGTSIARLAEEMGMDATKYKHITAKSGELDAGTWGVVADYSSVERFRDCVGLKMSCQKCKAAMEIRPAMEEVNDPSAGPASYFCSSCKTPPSFPALFNTLHSALRNLIRATYAGWLQCDDPSCATRTRQQPVLLLPNMKQACVVRGCRGELCPEYTSRQLMMQLEYFGIMVDQAPASVFGGDIELHKRLKGVVEEALRENAFYHVSWQEDIFAVAFGKSRGE